MVVDRELAARAELQTGWGTLADGKCGLGIIRMIWIIRRPTAGYGTPAEIRSASEMFHLGGAIPRRAHVELGISIVGEGLTVGIKCDSVWITQAGTEDFFLTTVRIHPEHMAFVVSKWLEFSPQRRGEIAGFGRELYGVAVNCVDFSIRPQG